MLAEKRNFQENLRQKILLFCENFGFLKNFFFSEQEAVALSFHWRRYLLKSDEKFLKYLAFGTISGQVAQKNAFSQ